MSEETQVAVVLSVGSLSNRVIRAGKFVEEVTYFVQDEYGNPVSGKTYKDEDSATVELGTLKFYASGLEFARAQFPDQSDKGHATKANMIAHFLQWQEDGKPVATAKQEEEIAIEEDTSGADPLDPNAEF